MPYKKSAISAAQIVESALRVLARQGYARTSLMDIAREAGMSKGAVHYHFPSKELLVTKVLQHACDQIAQRTIVAWSRGGTPFESLRAALEELWRARSERSDEVTVVADLIVQSFYDEALRPQLASYYQFAAGQIDEHLAKNLLAVGVRPKVPVRVLARILIAMLDGLVMQHFVEPGAVPPGEIVSAIEVMATGLFEVG